MEFTTEKGVALADGRLLNRYTDGLHPTVDKLEALMKSGVIQKELDRLLKNRRNNDVGVILVYLGKYRDVLSRQGQRTRSDTYAQYVMLRPSYHFLWNAVRHSALKPYAIRRRRSSKGMPAGIYLAVTKAKAQL